MVKKDPGARGGTGSTKVRPGPATKPGKAGKPDKAAKRAARAAKKTARRERWASLRAAFTMTRKADSKLIPLMLLGFLVPFVLLLSLALLLGGIFLVPLIFLGLLLGVVGLMVIFGRRVQSAQYTQVEGQPGAAAAVISSMRGDWRVTPAVGFNREQDLVHRVVGRPGVVLVAEGARSRTGGLVGTEKKKLARFVGDVPVYEVFVGEGDGQLPLRALERHFTKLPHNIKPREVNILDRKLKAMAPGMPLPKGPVPGQGGKAPKPKRR